jgi:hypothetical protein
LQQGFTSRSRWLLKILGLRYDIQRSVDNLAFREVSLMVVVLKNDEQIRDTRCRHAKVKGRAETLPFKMLAKSDNLFFILSNYH